MMSRKFLLCVAACAASLTASAAPVIHVVDQSKLQFSILEMRIKQGDTVKFTNSDRLAHNIMVTDGSRVLNSGLQQPGQPFEAPFTQKGTFPVTCGIHPKMRMTVVVE
jgi:plastocyanin